MSDSAQVGGATHGQVIVLKPEHSTDLSFLKNLATRIFYGISDTLQEFAVARDPVRYWHWELRRRGHKKEPEFSLVPFFCRGGGTMIDIGANKGAYVAVALESVQGAIAFEPHPHLASLLARGFAGKNVVVHNVALGDNTSEVTLRVPRGQWGRSTIEEGNPLENLRGKVDTLVVQRKTLDSFNLSQISFIKIDVEGHEASVLAGAFETIRRERPIIFVEAEDRHRAGTVSAVIELLEELGYHGAFVCQKSIWNIAQFDVQRHQSNDVSMYVRDFIFVPTEDDIHALRMYWESKQ